LYADLESGKYIPEDANELAQRVRNAVKNYMTEPKSKRQKLAKKEILRGKVYNPDDIEQEYELCVQFEHPTHSSYFRPIDNSYDNSYQVTSSGTANSRMSEYHLNAQIWIVQWINEGKRIELYYKCPTCGDLVNIFESNAAMYATKECYVSDGQTGRRLDIAIFKQDDIIVFNIEILFKSRTKEGKRTGPWAEVEALHVLDELEKARKDDADKIQLICEPRSDIKVCNNFREITAQNCIGKCVKCIENTACLCIVRNIEAFICRKYAVERIRNIWFRHVFEILKCRLGYYRRKCVGESVRSLLTNILKQYPCQSMFARKGKKRSERSQGDFEKFKDLKKALKKYNASI